MFGGYDVQDTTYTMIDQTTTKLIPNVSSINTNINNVNSVKINSQVNNDFLGFGSSDYASF
jgi:hypothetical protein